MRRTGKDRIGLTLCYGPPDNTGITDIFIGEVELESIAGSDGRIHEGDQILQVCTSTDAKFTHRRCLGKCQKALRV